MRVAHRQGEDGFTLVEILLIVVIIGVLAGIVVISLAGINERTLRSACLADVHSVQGAAEAFRAQRGAYPSDIDELLDERFLRSAPTNSGYALTYDSSTGRVSTTPSCASL